jgi:hypothetical protein
MFVPRAVEKRGELPGGTEVLESPFMITRRRTRMLLFGFRFGAIEMKD